MAGAARRVQDDTLGDIGQKLQCFVSWMFSAVKSHSELVVRCVWQDVLFVSPPPFPEKRKFADIVNAFAPFDFTI